jgi:Spy/CpxP family protein refolding chaperone
MDAVMKDATPHHGRSERKKKDGFKKKRKRSSFQFLTPEQQAKYKELMEKRKSGKS